MDNAETKAQLAELANSVINLAQMVGRYLDENLSLTRRIERLEAISSQSPEEID